MPGPRHTLQADVSAGGQWGQLPRGIQAWLELERFSVALSGLLVAVRLMTLCQNKRGRDVEHDAVGAGIREEKITRLFLEDARVRRLKGASLRARARVTAAGSPTDGGADPHSTRWSTAWVSSFILRIPRR